MFARTESLGQFIRYYPVVSVIIAIHLALYLASTLPIFPNYWFFDNFAGVNLYITHGEYWRLLTPIFLHGGFTHLLFNSFSLVLFGPGLERMLGRGKFIFVYLVSGIAANFATYLLEPLTYRHVGSSGAIFGLFGYYVSIVLLRKRTMSRQDSQTIVTIAAISIVMTFLQPNINITAHLFGLLAGFLLGAATGRR
ncbi:rhomboid family intramembrane serine protease [Neobacillus notoginsengisoli]|uniref:Rhomboid family intramembrane serine protease n=1 Tax=Neobacillus notoginsengisoli TaxID=1578198 RepID=A0A417YMI6_9BACI|nr:rhomboid family intramembrane serine protease [Neobacillus notoginsengisoli]RHW34868.1 rhomboid family intramembrane serine protease [Neobacillus notoginsengisoli]